MIDAARITATLAPSEIQRLDRFRLAHTLHENYLDFKDDWQTCKRLVFMRWLVRRDRPEVAARVGRTGGR